MESISHLHALAATRDVRSNQIGPIVELIRKAIDVTQDLWFLFVFDRETAALIRQANHDWHALWDL